jgi:CheY-like chemotaxis protein
MKGGEKLSVVLMDLEMPVMDGIACVKRIRELQAIGRIREHVPVIAVTGNARKDQIMMWMNAGMVSLLPLSSCLLESKKNELRNGADVGH